MREESIIGMAFRIVSVNLNSQHVTIYVTKFGPAGIDLCGDNRDHCLLFARCF